MTHFVCWPSGYKTHLVPVVQGDFKVSSDPDVTLTTILGSCVSVCLFDDVKKIGGMNHYLLANGPSESCDSLKYGAHAMELLINALLRRGAVRSSIKAKVFGGGKMSERFHDIGSKNALFAIQYLSDEGILVVSKDLHGNSARRINFHPFTGLARCALSKDTPEITEALPAKTKVNSARSIELF